ncbi:hypothetical protein CesoFtcFv8_018563 [Champsocephalus esox]|uniref:Uncharacterized protein n=1 Tax=Champsocephalus esox TaxID=159716 RepID=A0AAN8BGY9_9TELE|nr:hypothetical protein CesoFtcFv8_018563 [Champsocephalus esox]
MTPVSPGKRKDKLKCFSSGGLWGKLGEGLMETQWRSMDDVQADRQFNGSSEQISRPHTNQTRVHCY